MARPKPVCQSVVAFLQGNLGKRCFAPFTSQDSAAFDAAVHLLVLFNRCDGDYEPVVLTAFRNAVACMQPNCRHLAYHAIAHMMDWHARGQVWSRAGLPPLDRRTICAFEPGGSQRLAA